MLLLLLSQSLWFMFSSLMGQQHHFPSATSFKMGWWWLIQKKKVHFSAPLDLADVFCFVFLNLWLTSGCVLLFFLSSKPSYLLPTQPSPARTLAACLSSTAGCVSPWSTWTGSCISTWSSARSATRPRWAVPNGPFLQANVSAAGLSVSLLLTCCCALSPSPSRTPQLGRNTCGVLATACSSVKTRPGG